MKVAPSRNKLVLFIGEDKLCLLSVFPGEILNGAQ